MEAITSINRETARASEEQEVHGYPPAPPVPRHSAVSNALAVPRHLLGDAFVVAVDAARRRRQSQG